MVLLKSFGLSNLQTGFVTSLPYIVGVISMVLWGRNSERKLEHGWHFAIALQVAAGAKPARVWRRDRACVMLRGRGAGPLA